MDPWLIVGLGNPGAKYALNRHNIGAIVVAELAAAAGAKLAAHKSRALVAQIRLGVLPGGLPGPSVVLAAPQTFMNLSGGAVAAVSAFYSIPIERIIAVDLFPEALERLRGILAGDWPDLLNRLETSGNADAAVRQADIVCTATTSKTPVFADASIRPGTHVNAVGAYTPEMQELPAGLVMRATVTVDAVEPALAEAGDLIIPLQQGLVDVGHFSRELGMVVAGTVPGRRDDAEVTLFKSVGNAVQDVVVARRAYDRATAGGTGTPLDLGA